MVTHTGNPHAARETPSSEGRQSVQAESSQGAAADRHPSASLQSTPPRPYMVYVPADSSHESEQVTAERTSPEDSLAATEEAQKRQEEAQEESVAPSKSGKEPMFANLSHRFKAEPQSPLRRREGNEDLKGAFKGSSSKEGT